MNLDYDLSTFRALLGEAGDMLCRLYRDAPDRKVVQVPDAARVEALFAEELPRRGMDPRRLLCEVEEKVLGTATLHFGRSSFLYVQSGANQVGVLADLLAAGINQNGAKWHLAPPGVEVERRVIRWLGEFLGYGADCSGVLASGGSAGNLLGIAAARSAKAPWDVANEGLAGHPPLVAYASVETHKCLQKTFDLLGHGRSALREIPVRPDFTIDLEALERAVQADRRAGVVPFCVVANAGTVNTGAVDPLDRLADLCGRHDLWLHVDGAYGAPAAAAPSTRQLFRGLERADSVTVDPHKWLFVPFEAGAVLVRDDGALLKAFRTVADYLETDAGTRRPELHERSFQLSRGFRALKIWMTFKAHGADAIRDAIEDNVACARHLEARVREAEDFELLAGATLSIVNFRYTGRGGRSEAELEVLNRRLVERSERDGRIFLTGTRVAGRFAVRVIVVNHRNTTDDLDRVLDVLRELGRELEDEAARAAGDPSLTGARS